MRTISGIAASPGIAIGPIFVYVQVDLKFERIQTHDTASEWSRLEQALSVAATQLTSIRSGANRNIGEQEGAIFMAQAAMLQDPELLAMARKNLEASQLNVEAAWCDATEHYAHLLESLETEYMRARATDVRDVSRRVLGVLLGVAESSPHLPDAPSIICAEDLSPSDTVGLDKKQVLGFCTAGGGETSHTAILARALGLPAMVGVGGQLAGLAHGNQAILSGSEGKLFVDPSETVVRDYQLRQGTDRASRLEALGESHLPATTTDGHRVEVVANIGDAQGAKRALELGAEGVGLLRTEFLYLGRSGTPSEEEQYRAYRDILTTFGALPVILRTLDIGGDKEIPYLNLAHETNPFLGVRGIRLCLARPDLFKPQLRAALRAGVGCNLKIMFPMIAVADEVRRARKILEECREELLQEGLAVADDTEVGIMVEVPSAALSAERLAPIVDFFSIGTNDLSQYTLAVDRTNAAVSSLSSAFSPAVLRLIHEVVRAAHRHRKWVGLCGELAGDVSAVPLLVGLGLDELSMNPIAIPAVKKAIRSLTLKECTSLAEAAMGLEDASAVRALLASLARF